jgi:hypothetical protein
MSVDNKKIEHKEEKKKGYQKFVHPCHAGVPLF